MVMTIDKAIEKLSKNSVNDGAWTPKPEMAAALQMGIKSLKAWEQVIEDLSSWGSEGEPRDAYDIGYDYGVDDTLKFVQAVVNKYMPQEIDYE